MKLLYYIKLILKGILFYSTIISIVLFVCGIDSLWNNNIFGLSVIINITLLVLCFFFINGNDLYKLTFTKEDNYTDEV